jgi:hypothetical protein
MPRPLAIVEQQDPRKKKKPEGEQCPCSRTADATIGRLRRADVLPKSPTPGMDSITRHDSGSLAVRSTPTPLGVVAYRSHLR